MIALLCVFNFGVGWIACISALNPVDVISYSHVDYVYITTWFYVLSVIKYIIQSPALSWISACANYKFSPNWETYLSADIKNKKQSYRSLQM